MYMTLNTWIKTKNFKEQRVMEQRHITQKLHSYLYGAQNYQHHGQSSHPFLWRCNHLELHFQNLAQASTTFKWVLTSCSHHLASPDLVKHYQVQCDLVKSRCASDKKTCVADTNIKESQDQPSTLWRKPYIIVCSSEHLGHIFPSVT